MKNIYPKYNSFVFSRYFNDRFSPSKSIDREYFPIMTDIAWRDGNEVEKIHGRIKNIDPKKNYFTVTELLNFPLPDNVLNFGAGHGNIAIPYLSDLPETNISSVEKRKNNIFFRGSLAGKRETLKGKHFVSAEYMRHPEYFDELNNTVFALCPQGCDYSSYRLYEAMNFGCIPVYISDTHWLPFSDLIDWNSFCLQMKWGDNLEAIINNVDPVVMQKKVLEHQKYFTPDFTYDYIIKSLLNT